MIVEGGTKLCATRHGGTGDDVCVWTCALCGVRWREAAIRLRPKHETCGVTDLVYGYTRVERSESGIHRTREREGVIASSEFGELAAFSSCLVGGGEFP